VGHVVPPSVGGPEGGKSAGRIKHGSHNDSLSHIEKKRRRVEVGKKAEKVCQKTRGEVV